MRNGNHIFLYLSSAIAFGLLPAYTQSHRAMAQENVQAVKPVTAVRSTLGISYPEGSTLGIKFRGTKLLPDASGEAKVERKRGTTEIEIELDEMKPAPFFGGDIATYVLWTVSPEGHVSNAGEFIIQGNRSKLDVTTPLQTFGMFITAEPHFLVRTPSRYVVLENTRPAREVSTSMVKTSTIEYKGFDGTYNVGQETLADLPESKGEARSDMKQARVAVDLAKRAGAAEFAPRELADAESLLNDTINAVEAKTAKQTVMVMAHDTVRKALKAQIRAEEESFQAALDAERAEKAQEINQLEASIANARSEAERERYLAEQRQMKLEMEQRARSEAQQRAAEAARLAAEEAAKRAHAEQEASLARQQAQTLASEKQQAEADAAAARREREAARARLQAALTAVAETRETARGLIVNLPDILFEFDKSDLKPQAREVLSKICGILSVTDAYNLKVEGHTDSVGSDEYNQALSERRAQSVDRYLSSCGLDGKIVAVKGFGEAKPVASNDTAEGRQKNRRVELVIEDRPATLSSLTHP